MIWNPESALKKVWNPESRNLESGIQRLGIRNPPYDWIPLHGAISKTPVEYLELKRIKRSEERKKCRMDLRSKTYENFNWDEMFQEGTLSKLTVPILDIFLCKHNLAQHKKAKKTENVRLVSAWLASHILNTNQADEEEESKENEETRDDESEVDENEEEIYNHEPDNNDIVLCEIGMSSDEDNYSDSDEDPVPSVRTRVGRAATTYMTRRFYVDSD